jgi:CDP-4-dehydro-6-deoxyglucose reductase, E1
MRTTRQDVLSLSRKFYEEQVSQEFVPGKSYIPPSGKVVDADDLSNLIDASLDMWLTAGRYADDFETALADYFGLRFSRLTVSGSAANLLALTALTSPKLGDRRLSPGSEVLTVAAGFPTTVSPIVQNRCIPVFVDVDIGTYNVNVEQLAASVTPETKAIMIAHTLGNPFNLAAVKELADEHNLYLIEDCCDALGATYGGESVGTFGDMATLSFYPAHHITMGEGGAVMMNRKSYSRLVESFRDWGRDCWCPPGQDNTCEKRFGWKMGDLPDNYDHKYIYSHLGYNMKTTDMNAAVGLSQLSKVDGFVAARRDNFTWLSEAFRREGLDEHFVLPEATPGSEPSWFGFLLTIRENSPLQRREVVDYLENHRVGTRLLFAGNITKQPAFESVEYRTPVPLTNSDIIMERSFWIGLWPGIKSEQRNYMMETMVQMTKELVQ